MEMASETFVLNPTLTWLMARDFSALVHSENFKSAQVFFILNDVIYCARLACFRLSDVLSSQIIFPLIEIQEFNERSSFFRRSSNTHKTEIIEKYE
jgi:hypothetical protein